MKESRPKPGDFLFLPFALHGWMIAVVVLTSSPANGQVGDTRPDMDIIFNDLTRMYNRDVRKNLTNVEGSPLYVTDHFSGDVTLFDGKKYRNLTLNINLYTNEVIYFNQAGQPVVLQEGLIKEVTVRGENKTDVIFRAGYVPVDEHDGNTFYQVVEEGKITLLKLFQLSIVEGTEFDKRKSFERREYYYLLVNGRPTKVKNKNACLELFGNDREAMEAYIKTNKLGFRTEEDLIHMVRYYNSR
jgi:hypothetical protein